MTTRKTLPPRRLGDPPVLVADSGRARELLGWRPARSELPTIIADAWRWHCREVGRQPARNAASS